MTQQTQYILTFRNPETGETTTLLESATDRYEAIRNGQLAIEYTQYRDWYYTGCAPFYEEGNAHL